MNRSAFLRFAAVAPWWLQYSLAGGAPATEPDPRAAAVAWLLAKQSADGAWRSDTYGAFRDGRALTPMVLRALSAGDPAGVARDRACAWLLGQGAGLFEMYPVHLASDVLGSLPRCPALKPLADIARARLLSLQCPQTGGWSYSLSAPPTSGELSPIEQSNLAATTLAIEGLRAGGIPAGDPRLSRALIFIRSCQNHATGDAAFDDGGFFQLPGDPVRNKAGNAGVDRSGKPRHFSYASATADGLRALLLCGESPDSPQVTAAAAWLDGFTWDTLGARNSPVELVYHTARGMGRCAVVYPPMVASSARLAASLVAKQRTEGSWRHPAGRLREDCEIVATAMALEALSSAGPR